MSNKDFRPERLANSRTSPPELARAAAVRYGVVGIAVGDVVAFGRPAGFDSPEVRMGVDAYVQPSQSENADGAAAQTRPAAAVAIEQPSAIEETTKHAAVVPAANGISTAPFEPAQTVVGSIVPERLDPEKIRGTVGNIYAEMGN